MNRTDRLLAITLELRAHRYTRAEDLAAQFEVSVRTVYRDIEALCEAGVPVVATPGYGYSLAEGYFLPPVMLTADEAGMLLLGANFVHEQVDAPYQQAIDTARKKIQKLLPETTQCEVEFLQDSFRFVNRQVVRPEDADRLALLRRAVLGQEVVHLVYQARHGEPAERDIEPHGLVNFSGVWMLAAYCRVRQDMRAFRLDRMLDARPTGQRFQRRQDFSLRRRHTVEYGSDEVQVLLTAQAARWAREPPPYSLVREEAHADGVVMVFRPRGLEELMPWLLSWGAQAQVLAPEAARQALLDAGRAIVARYASPQPGV